MKNKSLAYDKMVVIFLDILGTKNCSSFNNAYNYHRIFHEECNLNQKRQNNVSFNARFERKIFSFSDCAYIIYCLKEHEERNEENLLKLLNVALHNTLLSILNFYDNGILIRGGVAVGDTYVDELGFFGPAINKAYTLEDKEALYPRILIDDDWGSKLFKMYTDRLVQARKDIQKQGFKSEELIEMYTYPLTKNILSKDNLHDSKYFLNIFFDKTDIFMENKVISFSNMVRNLEVKIKADLNQTQDKRVKEKLEWMISYIDSNMK